MNDTPYMARGSVRGLKELAELAEEAAQAKVLRDEVDALRGELEFWKQAAETQKDNNLKLLDEIRSLKVRKEDTNEHETN